MTKPLRVPDHVDGAYRVVLARNPDHEIEGCELLVFGTGKGGAFHLQGSDRRIPARDLRDVPLVRSQWRAIVEFVEAKRLWEMGSHDDEGPVRMDGVFNSFESLGSSVHPCHLAFGSAPGKRVRASRRLRDRRRGSRCDGFQADGERVSEAYGASSIISGRGAVTAQRAAA